MKILLDIDGVMIPARSWQSHQIDSDGFGMFSKFSIVGLNKIISSARSSEIVLTTSHKHAFSLSKWEDIFSKRGIKKVKIDRLPTDSLQVSRIEEIRTWYLKNQNEPFIILDDDKGLNDFDSNFKKNHLVLTQPTIGLNSLTVDEAIRKIQY
tara:strand:+ start:829 stop:1284 length:456 start_codon:yes stop_codon:yes gene_type:complete